MNHSSGQPNFDFESLYQVISLINIEYLITQKNGLYGSRWWREVQKAYKLYHKW